MNAKAKGSRREHRSIALLESAGYRCTRAAASLGAWDIIGIGSTDLVLVQVKSPGLAGVCGWVATPRTDISTQPNSYDKREYS